MTSLVIRSFSGQPATVSSTSTVTSPPRSMETSLTMSRSVMGRWISGSITCPSAVMTCVTRDHQNRSLLGRAGRNRLLPGV